MYDTVIGLEVHVELKTKSKIFCSCPVVKGASPNTCVCPTCMGFPGTLPVLNTMVPELAIRAGLLTNCEITKRSVFDRKNYFYPDNPQNYQISQLYAPICRSGYVEIDAKNGKKRVRIREIHMEEDAGKLIHAQDGTTLVDLNRAGVPLIEIVTEPDMESGEEALSFLKRLRELLTYADVSDCRMQEGSMRADVNLSLKPHGSRTPGTRTEMKNLNSFTAVIKAAEYEAERQRTLLERGERVVQETRRWDEASGQSFSMRGKEGAADYRYFPDPDLPPLVTDEETIERIRTGLPESMQDRQERFVKEYGLPQKDAAIITQAKPLADVYEGAAKLSGLPAEAAKWIIGPTMRLLRGHGMAADEMPFSSEHLAALIGLVRDGRISRNVAASVYEVIFAVNGDPENYVAEHGLSMNSDEGSLRTLIEGVLKENQSSVEDLRNGKTRAFGFLVGQVMKASGGSADPKAVNRILKEVLG